MQPCIFMDRDGVLNEERGEYTFEPEDFIIPAGVPEALRLLKQEGYLLIVITNQSGISRGFYTREQMEACHSLLNEKTGHVISEIYYSPYHPDITLSLSRKPGTLMFERALSKYSIDVVHSWMVGDSERDMIPAGILGINTLFIGKHGKYPFATSYATDMPEAARIILDQSSALQR